MDGTSARGQRAFRQRHEEISAGELSLGGLIDFYDDALDWLRQKLPSFETGLILVDPFTGKLACDGLRSTCTPPGVSPAWLDAHMAQHPSLQQKLSQGELVGITGAEPMAAGPRPAEESRASVVLVPVLEESTLLGALGIVSWINSSQPSAEQMATIRACATEAAPSIARVFEVARLRAENKSLKATVNRLALVEQSAREHASRNTELEVGAKMRSYLHSNVAHELRTPLAAIRGYARMIVDGRSGDINERQRDYLAIVIENANKMIHLVTWMGDVFESAQHMRLTTVDFRDAWTRSVKDFETVMADKGIRLTAEIPDEPFTAFVDQDRMNDVFKKMLCGAIHYSDTGAKLTARFSRGRENEITVKLSGITREIPAAANAGESDAIDFSSVHTNVGVQGGRFFIRRTSEEGSVLLMTVPAILNEIQHGSDRP